MATARTAEVEEAPPPKPKRGVGRPRTKPDPPAPSEITPEMRQAAMTGAELDKNTELGFFELLQAYDPIEWERNTLFMYLFRTAPVIDRGRTGNDFNIQKFTKPTTSDEIMKSSYGGSGGYKMNLLRYDANTRLSKPIRTEYFRILNYDYPPRIPAGEWLDSDNNKEWAWAKPKLEALARKEAADAAAAAGHTGAAPAGESNQIVELLKQLLPAGRKDEARAIADEVVHAIERDGSKGSRGLEAVVLRLLDKNSGGDAELRAELAESRRFQNELLLKIAERGNPAPAAAAPARSLAQELKELVEVKSVIGQLFGRGGAPADSKLDWQQVGMHVADKLFAAAPGLLQAFALGKAGIRQPARHAPAAPGTPAIPAGGQPVETPEEVREMIAQISNQFGPMFDEVTPFLSNYFVRDVTGMHFRDWFINEYGRKAYDGMRQLHPQTMVDVIELRKTQAPTELLRSQLSELKPTAKLMEFVQQFLSSEPAEFEDDEPEPATPPPPAPNGAARPGDF